MVTIIKFIYHFLIDANLFLKFSYSFDWFFSNLVIF